MDQGRIVSAAKPNSLKTVRAVEWLNFFLADVQTGLGPFLAAYLAASGWSAGRVGYVLTFGGLVTVATQTPAGAFVDATHRKRSLIAAALGVLCVGAILLAGRLSPFSVYTAQFLIGFSAAFLAPTLAAITLGIVGAKLFDKQFGRNQAFNSAGNVCAALLIALVAHRFGYRAIFVVAALLCIPALISLWRVDPEQIDYSRSRGGKEDSSAKAEGLRALLSDRRLLGFLVAAFLFHLANAAMLPQLGELLTRNNLKAAATFMSASIVVTQVVITSSAAFIGRRSQRGRKPLLLVGFGVLPIRAVLYTLTHAAPALLAIQVLDGVANAIFVVVSVLVIADLTRGTGRFNLASGALATMVGIGASLSATVGGQLIQHAGFSTSFLGLGAIAVIAFAILWIAVPETLGEERSSITKDDSPSPELESLA